MGKKMKLLPSLLRNTEVKKSSSSSSSSWPWPSCHQPKTLSFRANNDIFKTLNSAYFDGTTTMEVLEISSESFFTVSPDDDSASFSTNASDEDSTRDQDSIETVIRGLRSDRLFFEADETSSILESKAPAAAAGGGVGGADAATTLPFKDSVVLSMDSQDPYVDFRKSMEEMVEAHGIKDWEGLEKLLCWYLRVNGKTNHGYIVGAFVDLLVALALASASASSTSSTSSSSYSPSSPLSFYSSSMSSSCSTRCVSCLVAEDEIVDTSAPSSSSLLEQVKGEIKIQDEACSSPSSSSN